MDQYKQIRQNITSLLLGVLTLSMVAWGVNTQAYLQSGMGQSVLGFGYGPGFTTGPDTGSVTVSAQVFGCYILIRVYPEKRIPQIGNWSNQMFVDVFNSGDTLLTTLDITSNNLGFSPPIDMCAILGTPPGPGTYAMRVKGLSHLRMRFPSVSAFTTVQTLFDLVNLRPPLLAGETSIVFDNFINGLDLSTQVNELYTGDVKNDLNRDGIVNSLDLSNTIFNLYVFGEN